MKTPVRTLASTIASMVGLSLVAAQGPPAPQEPSSPPGQSEIRVAITGDVGAPLHYAVPDFIALTPDKETADAARLIAEVLWSDLAFEREFDMIPRDTYKTIDGSVTDHRSSAGSSSQTRSPRIGQKNRQTFR